MQSDEPQYKTGFTVTEEEDEDHVKMHKVLTFAQPCEYRGFFVFRFEGGWRDVLRFVGGRLGFEGGDDVFLESLPQYLFSYPSKTDCY